MNADAFRLLPPGSRAVIKAAEMIDEAEQGLAAAGATEERLVAWRAEFLDDLAVSPHPFGLLLGAHKNAEIVRLLGGRSDATPTPRP